MGLLFLCMEHMLQKYCNKKYIISFNNKIWSWPEKTTNLYNSDAQEYLFLFRKISNRQGTWLLYISLLPALHWNLWNWVRHLCFPGLKHLVMGFITHSIVYTRKTWWNKCISNPKISAFIYFKVTFLNFFSHWMASTTPALQWDKQPCLSFQTLWCYTFLSFLFFSYP